MNPVNSNAYHKSVIFRSPSGSAGIRIEMLLQIAHSFKKRIPAEIKDGVGGRGGGSSGANGFEREKDRGEGGSC